MAWIRDPMMLRNFLKNFSEKFSWGLYAYICDGFRVRREAPEPHPEIMLIVRAD